MVRTLARCFSFPCMYLDGMDLGDRYLCYAMAMATTTTTELLAGVIILPVERTPKYSRILPNHLMCNNRINGPEITERCPEKGPAFALRHNPWALLPCASTTCKPIRMGPPRKYQAVSPTLQTTLDAQKSHGQRPYPWSPPTPRCKGTTCDPTPTRPRSGKKMSGTCRPESAASIAVMERAAC